ncbi:hypothetical protein CDAR_492231 [Caerostris darwini]|uniref:Uncharacterized protein n=1 Tax=Caerostris darwini TaxID=1538125 RepID=A0AAV4UZH3_9ARAC|nr:hypothetical protein CDAR_492231 [Caerostris darwini]
MFAMEDFIIMNFLPVFYKMIDYVFENRALVIILAADYIVMCFLFSKCLTQSEASAELEKTTPSSDEVFAPQHGGRGAKDNTTEEENFPANIESPGMKPVPVVQSNAVWLMCIALGIPANFDPESDGKGFVIKNKTHSVKKSKNIPIVQSEKVFMFCQALGLEAKLAKGIEKNN